MVLGSGPEKGMELLGDIQLKEPDLYQEVVLLLPQYARPLPPGAEEHGRAEELFAQFKFREAIVEYKAAIKLNHDNELAYLGLGDAHYRLGEYHLATAYFSESIAIRPTPQGYHFLGDAIQQGRGDRRRARQCYVEALALDPGYQGAREKLDHLPGPRQGEEDDNE
jgi:tetratricopeptide (TPR) repeat protein